MRKEATLQQWRELYDIAKKIKKMKPWEQLYDGDLIAIHLPEREEPIYCSVMGRAGECYGIACYEGDKGLEDITSLAMITETGLDPMFAIMNQTNLSLYYGNNDHVPPEQKQVIKDLGLRFRGDGNWIYFESYKAGYAPFIPDLEEAELLIQVLNQLVQGILDIQNGKTKSDYERATGLLRRYDDTQSKWVNDTFKVQLKEKEYPKPEISDEIELQRLRKSVKGKNTDYELILELAYVGLTVDDNSYDRPINPLALLVVDGTSEMIMGTEMISPDQDISEYILKYVKDILIEKGRPSAICGRNPYVTNALDYLCKDLKIPLISDSDAFVMLDEIYQAQLMEDEENDFWYEDDNDFWYEDEDDWEDEHEEKPPWIGFKNMIDEIEIAEIHGDGSTILDTWKKAWMRIRTNVKEMKRKPTIMQLEEETDFLYDLSEWIENIPDVMLEMGNNEECLLYCREVLTLFDWSEETPTAFIINIGESLMSQGKTKENEDWLMENMDKYPDNPFIVAAMSRHYMYLKQPQKARRVLETLFDPGSKCDDDNHILFVEAARIYQSLGEKKLAKQCEKAANDYEEQFISELEEWDDDILPFN